MSHESAAFFHPQARVEHEMHHPLGLLDFTDLKFTQLHKLIKGEVLFVSFVFSFARDVPIVEGMLSVLIKV